MPSGHDDLKREQGVMTRVLEAESLVELQGATIRGCYENLGSLRAENLRLKHEIEQLKDRLHAISQEP